MKIRVLKWTKNTENKKYKHITKLKRFILYTTPGGLPITWGVQKISIRGYEIPQTGGKVPLYFGKLRVCDASTTVCNSYLQVVQVRKGSFVAIDVGLDMAKKKLTQD